MSKYKEGSIIRINRYIENWSDVVDFYNLPSPGPFVVEQSVVDESGKEFVHFKNKALPSSIFSFHSDISERLFISDALNQEKDYNGNPISLDFDQDEIYGGYPYMMVFADGNAIRITFPGSEFEPAVNEGNKMRYKAFDSVNSPKEIDQNDGNERSIGLLKKLIVEYDFELKKEISFVYCSKNSGIPVILKRGKVDYFFDINLLERYCEQGLLVYHYQAGVYALPSIETLYIKENYGYGPKEGTQWNVIRKVPFSETNKIAINRNFELGSSPRSFNVSENLPYTFGVEIETSSGYIPDFALFNLNAKSCHDGSITGKEYVSGVLRGDGGFKQLATLSGYIARQCNVDHKCGLHVHIGSAKFNKTFTVAAYVLGLRLQDEIFSMMPISRLNTRNEYYLNKGMSSSCGKIPTLHSIKKMRLTENNLSPDVLKDVVDEIYEEIYQWLLDGSSRGGDANVNKYNNKFAPHSHQYPKARYVWLNLVPCNFARNNANHYFAGVKGQNFRESISKAFTIEFRNHQATMDYRKIKNWILFCMAFVNYVENNSVKILLSKKITIEDVIRFSYRRKGDSLINYINSQKEKYSPADPDVNAQIEDKEYTSEANRKGRFTNSFKDLLTI